MEHGARDKCDASVMLKVRCRMSPTESGRCVVGHRGCVCSCLLIDSVLYAFVGVCFGENVESVLCVLYDGGCFAACVGNVADCDGDLSARLAGLGVAVSFKVVWVSRFARHGGIAEKCMHEPVPFGRDSVQV